MSRTSQYARSYYLTYERKSQLNEMHKGNKASMVTVDPTGDKRKQEQLSTPKVEEPQQNDKCNRGNSYRGNNRNNN